MEQINRVAALQEKFPVAVTVPIKHLQAGNFLLEVVPDFQRYVLFLVKIGFGTQGGQ